MPKGGTGSTMGPIRWVVWRSTSTHESVRAGLISVRQRAWPSAQDTGKDYRVYGAIPARIEKRPEARTNIHDKGLRCFNPPSHDATARRPAPYPYRGFGRHIDLRSHASASVTIKRPGPLRSRQRPAVGKPTTPPNLLPIHGTLGRVMSLRPNRA